MCGFVIVILRGACCGRSNTDGETDRNFPFGWVQLNSNGQPDGPRAHPQALPSSLQNGTQDKFGIWKPGFPSLRWAQTQSILKVERGFQAVVLDTPSPSGAIHSCHKQPVGSRLARGALATAYGREDLKVSAALSGAVVAPDRRTLTVSVANASGLIVRDRLGFEVLAGHSSDTTTWRWYSSPILTSDGVQTLTLSLANITVLHSADTIVDTRSIGVATHTQGREASLSVMAVRYLWANSPCSADVFNCPVYVPVPKLGSLTGEHDTIPLGPAIIIVGAASN